METVALLVLAAGLGKRMKSDLPKVLVAARGQPLLAHVLRSAAALRPERVIIVTGYRAELVEERVNSLVQSGLPVQGLQFTRQLEQRGTGDAVKSALPALVGYRGTVLIVCGDTPLLRADTLTRLVETHAKSGNAVTLLSARVMNANQYGRVLRSADGAVVERIVEARDCSPAELQINEINTGVYAVDATYLAPAVSALTNANAQREYYLTDIVGAARAQGKRVGAVVLHDGNEALGVNDPLDLAAIERIMNARKIEELQRSGVRFEDPASAYIDDTVRVGKDTVIGPNVQLRGSTVVGEGCVFEGTALLKDTTVGDHVLFRLGVRTEDAKVGTGSQIGPFAHLRPGTVLGEAVHIGNFVETKKATLATGAKANHLTYLGDVTVGERTNVGAGTITCNYDGYGKYQTTIGNDVFIGSDTCLVAPVEVQDGATIGAGSVITKTVEKDSLALTRAELMTKPGWSKNRRERAKKR